MEDLKKFKRTIYLDDETWNFVKALKSKEKRSISQIIKEAIYQYAQKYSALYLWIAINAPYVDDNEQKEIEKYLKSLTPEDLEIVYEEEL